MKILLLYILFVVGYTVSEVTVFYPPQGVHMKLMHDIRTDSCTVLESSTCTAHKKALRSDAVVKEILAAHLESEIQRNGTDPLPETEFVVHLYGMDRASIWKEVHSMCKSVEKEFPPKQQSADQKVYKIHITGDPSNRIDYVMMGDGYTSAEQTRHEGDMERLFERAFHDPIVGTFHSYEPLLNVWAVYLPSVQSGVGVNGVPLDTAYQLVRAGTTLRGISSRKPQAARDACKLTGPNACDFPSLIANSDYYGGSGGEFTIGTRSIWTGSIVLIHEMGHTMGRVGEEYDGGGYFGANTAATLPQVQAKWGKWLTHGLREEESIIRVQQYMWANMIPNAYTIRFTSDGTWKRWFMRISVSGCETDDSLRITLDGQPLEWKSFGELDRWFYDFYKEESLSAGEHVLVFSSIPPVGGNPIRQLCSATFHEYQDESKFVWSDDSISAYRTFSSATKFGGFRPTNEMCLMRNTMEYHFCGPDQENLWHQFLSKMSLIDNVTVVDSGPNVEVTASVVALAQFRAVPIAGESYTLQWFRNNVEQVPLKNQFSWTGSAANSQGNWRAQLTFETLEVRNDPNNNLVDTVSFTIPQNE